MLPRRLGQVVRVRRPFLRVQMLVEQRADVFFLFVDGRQTMWLGGSPASCTMRSPRSVSTTSMPFRSRNGLRWHSSVSIDLLLTSRRTPWLLEDAEHDLVVLGRVARPVDVGAEPRRLRLELFQVVGEVGQSVRL